MTVENTTFQSVYLYRVGSVVMDNANHKLLKPPREEETAQQPRFFYKL